jgi:hypothetical protein
MHIYIINVNMKNSIEYHNKVINQINQTISILTEQSDDERKSDVNQIRSDIEDIRSMIYDLKTSSSIDFSRITLDFYNEYELSLPKYGLESFDRSLKGEMYFSVLGGNDDYIDIKTNSFPISFRIRLYYETLKTMKRQYGKAFLIYKSGTERLEGEETEIIFKIIKKE